MAYQSILHFIKVSLAKYPNRDDDDCEQNYLYETIDNNENQMYVQQFEAILSLRFKKKILLQNSTTKGGA